MSLCFIAAASALAIGAGGDQTAQTEKDSEVRILRNEREDFEDGGYRF